MARERVEDLREHLQVLEDFDEDYRSYISALETIFGATSPLHGTSQADQRQRILRKTPRAQRALDASGVGLTVTPPPAFGGHALRALASQVMAHENPTYSPHDDPFMVSRLVMDGLTAARGALEDKIEQAERGRPHRQSAVPIKDRLPTVWGAPGRPAAGTRRTC